MIYVIRKHAAAHTLIELKSPTQLSEWQFGAIGGDTHYSRVSPSYAHQWVRNGREHETGLFIDGKRVRYARSEAGA